MLYWLADLSGQIGFFNVFRYLTVRTGASMMTSLVFVFWLGPTIIDLLRLRQGKGQPIRTDGPQSHLVTKKGTPTMGDRKSTRLNSSHTVISYAVFCLKKKKTNNTSQPIQKKHTKKNNTTTTHTTK